MTSTLTATGHGPASHPTAQAALYPLLNNLFWVHQDIVAVISRWLPRIEADDERTWLGEHAAREAHEVGMYRKLVHQLGREPDVSYRIRDSLLRYGWLRETEDYAEVLVGMNVLAQAVLGWIEHNALLRFDAEFFAPFVDTVSFDAANWQRAQIMMRRHDQTALQAQFQRYYDHLTSITIPELTPLLEPVIALGVFPADIFEIGEARYLGLAAELGISIDV